LSSVAGLGDLLSAVAVSMAVLEELVASVVGAGEEEEVAEAVPSVVLMSVLV